MILSKDRLISSPLMTEKDEPPNSKIQEFVHLQPIKRILGMKRSNQDWTGMWIQRASVVPFQGGRRAGQLGRVDTTGNVYSKWNCRSMAKIWTWGWSIKIKSSIQWTWLEIPDCMGNAGIAGNKETPGFTGSLDLMEVKGASGKGALNGISRIEWKTGWPVQRIKGPSSLKGLLSWRVQMIKWIKWE